MSQYKYEFRYERFVIIIIVLIFLFVLFRGCSTKRDFERESKVNTTDSRAVEVRRENGGGGLLNTLGHMLTGFFIGSMFSRNNDFYDRDRSYQRDNYYNNNYRNDYYRNSGSMRRGSFGGSSGSGGGRGGFRFGK